MQARPTGSARLNPFAFAADTDLRFLLLIVLVASTSLFAYDILRLINPLATPGSPVDDVLPACRDAAKAAFPEGSREANDAFLRCLQPGGRSTALIAFGQLAVLLAVAGAVYWLWPVWKLRRGHLVPLSPDDAPEVVEYLAALCREVGLVRPPRFVWDPLSEARTGLAFGRAGAYHVALGGGLVSQFYLDCAGFRCVVLHELAHIRNGDVDKTYYAVSLWWVFVVTALVPCALSALFDVVIATTSEGLVNRWTFLVVNATWRMLALAALVLFTRNAILRARELYADVRASTWDQGSGALERALGGLAAPAGQGWRSLFSFHPAHRERQQALISTDRLFQLGLGDAFMTGVAASVTAPHIRDLLFPVVTSGSQRASLAPVAAALIFVPLAAGVVGVGTWRAAFAALARGRRPEGAGQLGLALGLGIIVGQPLSLSLPSLVSPIQAPEPAAALAFASVSLLWSALLLASLYFFMRWVETGAAAWLDLSTGRRSRAAYLFGLAAAGVVSAIWVGYLLAVRVGSEDLLLMSGAEASAEALNWLERLVDVGILFPAAHPLGLVAALLLWAYPLVGAHRRNAAGSALPEWAGLDGPLSVVSLPRWARLELSVPCALGVSGALVLAVWLGVPQAVVRIAPDARRVLDEWQLTGAYVNIAIPVLLQAGIAALAARRAPDAPWRHGLIAALIGACLMTFEVVVKNVLVGLEVNPDRVLFTFAILANVGAAAALPAILFAAGRPAVAARSALAPLQPG